MSTQGTPSRFAAFTDDELAGLAYALRQSATPLVSAVADQIHDERIRRLPATKES